MKGSDRKGHCMAIIDRCCIPEFVPRAQIFQWVLFFVAFFVAEHLIKYLLGYLF